MSLRVEVDTKCTKSDHNVKPDATIVMVGGMTMMVGISKKKQAIHFLVAIFFNDIVYP